MSLFIEATGFGIVVASILSIAAVGRRDTGLDAEFTSLVTEIRQAVTGPARS